MRPASAATFAAMLLSPDGAATAPAAGPAVAGGPGTTMVLPPLEPTAVLEGEPPKARRARPNRLAPWVVAGGLVALLALALALVSTVGGNGRPSPSPSPSRTENGVAIPNVLGKKLHDAETLLKDQGFEVRDVPVQGKHDVVVRTDPPPDTLALPGSTVTLYVGSGPEEHGKGKGHGGND